MSINAGALLQSMQQAGVDTVDDVSQFKVANKAVRPVSKTIEVTLLEPVVQEYLDSIVKRNVVFVKKSLLKLPIEAWGTEYNGFHVCNTSRKLDKLTVLIDRLGSKNIGITTLLRWLASPMYVNALLTDTVNAEFIKQYIVEKECLTEQELFAVLSLIKSYDLPIGGRFIVYRNPNVDLMTHMKNLYKSAVRISTECNVGIGDWSMQDCIEAWITDATVNVASFTAGCLCTDWLYNNLTTCKDAYSYAGFGNGADKGITYVTGQRKRYSDVYRLSVATKLLERWRDKSDYMITQVCERTGLEAHEVVDLAYKAKLPNPLKLIANPTLQDVEHWLCEFYKLSAMKDMVTTRRRLARYNNRGVSI